MRKPTFCICENKAADKLCGNCKADQHLCFRYIDSMIPLLSKSEISSLYPSSVAVQLGLWTSLETRTLVSWRGSNIVIDWSAASEQQNLVSFFHSSTTVKWVFYIRLSPKVKVMKNHKFYDTEICCNHPGQLHQNSKILTLVFTVQQLSSQFWFSERDLPFDCSGSCSLLFYYFKQFFSSGALQRSR